MSKWKIIRDTREQERGARWDFVARNWCGGTVERKLDTGDYAVETLEHVCVVERKATPSELATNLFEDRFYSELVRMKDIIHPYVVCQFPFYSIENYPVDSGVPKYRWKYLKIKGPLLLKTLTDAMLDYPYISWIFAETDKSAQGFVRGLFKRVVERHG